MASTSSIPTRSSSPKPLQRPYLHPVQWIWPGLWVLLLLGSGVFCGWALTWLTRIPPLPDCDEITPFNSARDLLYCAETQARSGSANDLAQAVHLTADWPKAHANYDDAQIILKTASEQILVISNRWAQNGRLDDAVKLAGQIPINTPLRKPAQAVIYEWQQDWKAGNELDQKLQAALQAQDWAAAQNALQTMKTLKSDYWLTTRYQQGMRQLKQEQQATEQLQTARDLAATEAPEALQQAITLARQINLNTYLWHTAETEVDQWSQMLLSYALELWQGGSREAALTIARSVPPSLHLLPAAEFLIQISHAQQLAEAAAPQGLSQAPSYQQLFQLREAIWAAATMPPESGLQGTAQGFVETWTPQLVDLTHLQMATVLAGFGQEPTYRWAMAEAQQVEQGRPRRIQGQTLIAQWMDNIERVEDRPILQESKRLAHPGTIPALQEAIAKAQTIELGRALRIDAQTLIADWQQEIQVIEDRPILDEALNLANAGDLKQAIEVARKVEPDRALYDRASSLIEEWSDAIEIAEDQPILDEAKDLAYIGSLTRAIDTASRIAPGRALYDQAQHAIGLWKAERKYIWSIWAEQGKGPLAGTEKTSDSE